MNEHSSKNKATPPASPDQGGDTLSPFIGLHMHTRKQAAEWAGISERKLWSLTYPRGDLPCVKLDGRIVRYDPRDLLNWARAHRHGGRSDDPRS